jgi:hypothetical protein
MKSYLFNVMNTYEVRAESEEQARELLDTPSAILRDGDVMLVEVRH